VSTRRVRRAIDGVLLLDKPAGISSNGALQRVKRHLDAERAGHAGTLDPFATGLLPIALGEATKYSSALIDADKRYEALARLGERTDTGDRDGQVIQTRQVAYTQAALDAAVARLTGRIRQVPPMYSALKRDGRPLYAYARAGEVVEREAREIHIHEFTILEHGPETLAVRVHCSKGTYVRTLLEDLGEMLGCGAHLTGLRRTGVGDFDLAASLTLAEVEALPFEGLLRRLLPVDAMIAALPVATITALEAPRFLNGQPVPQAAREMGLVDRVRVRESEGRFLGTARCDASGTLHPERVIRTAPRVSSGGGAIT